MNSSDTLLRVEHVSRRFGGLMALQDVSFTVREGEVRGIIGPNGAGKTTLFNVMTGELSATSGTIYLRDREISGIPPHKICQMGMGRTFQMTLVFPEMTVFESIWVGVNARNAYPWHPMRRLDRMKEEARQVQKIAAMVGLEERLNEWSANLSYGEQKVLEIAMALSTHPILLLLDEPTQGVSPKEAEMILKLVQKLSKSMTVILIEHSIEFVVRLCERLTVLNQGRLLMEGTPEEVSNNPEVRRVYLGEEAWDF